jgi:hypothetical protein
LAIFYALQNIHQLSKLLRMALVQLQIFICFDHDIGRSPGIIRKRSTEIGILLRRGVS